MLRIGPPADRPLLVGLWGCGHVGQQVAEGIAAGWAGQTRVVGVLARHESPELERTAALLGARPCTRLDNFLATGPDVVLEAASAAGLAELGPRILEAGRDLVALSPSCLFDPAVEARLREATETSGRGLLIPFGSADGLELIRAVLQDGVSAVRLTIFWKPNPDLHPYTGGGEPQEVFVGTARGAGQLYPRHLNFVVTIALNGLGLDQTAVRILVDPNAEHNTVYELEVEARTTAIRARVELRRPTGQRGRLAALSGIAALKELSEQRS
jgi:aspartate dehydrogenase